MTGTSSQILMEWSRQEQCDGGSREEKCIQIFVGT